MEDRLLVVTWMVVVVGRGYTQSNKKTLYTHKEPFLTEEKKLERKIKTKI